MFPIVCYEDQVQYFSWRSKDTLPCLVRFRVHFLEHSWQVLVIIGIPLDQSFEMPTYQQQLVSGTVQYQHQDLSKMKS